MKDLISALNYNINVAANLLTTKSADFVNSCPALTDEQKEKIIGINKSYEEMKKRHQEANDYRWKNYYDCVDDYSVCGIMDKAEHAMETRLLRENAILIEQLLRGGYFIHKTTCLQLREIETGSVFAGANLGRYGYYFTTKEGKFVSLSKKISTFNKKGYQPEVRTRLYKCVFSHISDKGNTVCKNIELIDENIEVINDNEVLTKTNLFTDFIDYCFDNNK
jgi:hypothetical protein